MSLDETGGPVRSFIHQAFNFAGTEVQAGGDGDALFAVFGTGTMTISTPMRGTINAPNALLTLSSSSGPFEGAFFADSILILPNTVVTGSGAVTPMSAPPASLTADGPSPASIFSAYVAHNPPPLNATGAGAAAQVATFITWAGASKPNEREDGRAVLAGASTNADVANALIAQYQASVPGDVTRALLILSLLGELRSDVGESFLISVTQQALPTTGTLADGVFDERVALEKLQSKAVDGLAYRHTNTADQEVGRLVVQSTSESVRAEAVRAYLYNNPSGRAAMSELLSESKQILLDRVEHGPDNLSDAGFDTRLEAFMTAHPEVTPPKPVISHDAGAPPAEGTELVAPVSANPNH